MKKMRSVAANLLRGVALLCAPVAMAAAPLTVTKVQVEAPMLRAYQCEGGKSLQVTYWNSRDGQSFALVPVDGKAMLFVNTMAASGVKYMADRYTWWTKGDHGDLYDMTAGPDAKLVVAGCSAVAK
ncbi:MliC family protein [Dyella silvae]|uniref:MliC family protein n=1 Tax=Dyella silvae TaxID=2994424 RepID=UPI0022640DBC|nr:MliC family protein [Dyella silvae]